ncbi:toxin Cry1Ac domain D-VI-related protein [Listeria grandensis]|uniref:toxin Cry1Ac domain D-VI-related protein n=1 Tax=Listeria grandensis TaxID=1494963 RepID=UPI00164D2EA4|nr:toxin Cry1Ac domain D-VI-related protein [Listeria grandensis]MBC6316288.1 hypothetical protein [Listeria grandensis]
MKKQQIKKLVSTLTVASIIGASVVTPFNVFANPAQAAEGIQVASTPVYEYNGNKFQNVFLDLSSQNIYFPIVQITDDVLYIDMTLVWKNYGIRVILPNGQTFDRYKSLTKGTYDYYTVDLKALNGGTIQLRTLNPNGSYERAGISTITLNTSGNTGVAINTYGQAVYNLFSDSTFTKLGTNVTQSDINAAKALAANVPNSTEKTNLTNLVNKAQSVLDADNKKKDDDARIAVNALFNNNSPSTDVIKPETTQGSINAAQALVNQVTDPTKKAQMQTDLDRAKELLTTRDVSQSESAKQAVANKAVKELFVNDSPASNEIKAATNQKAIDDAQATINAIVDPATKSALQADLNKAQALLDARGSADQADKEQQAVAGYLVNQLFKDNTPKTDAIKDVTTQAKIDEAQIQVDLVKDPAAQVTLQRNLNRAQTLLNAKNALNQAEKDRQVAADNAVNALFTSNNPATDAIKPTTNQKAIDDAQKVVNAVTDPAKQVELQVDLDKAQSLLDAAVAAEKAKQAVAEKAVNELFTNNSPLTGAIKPATDQKAIDDAQKVIDGVTDPAKKAALQVDLDKAQSLLDAAVAAEKANKAVAEEAVNALFTSNKPTTNTIKPTTNQAKIDEAQELVDAVKNPTEQVALQANLDKAQALLDAVTDGAAAEKAKQEAATTAVNELFTNNLPTSNAIKPTTNQKAIDDAQKVVSAVTDPTKKAALQKDLDKAQSLLDAAAEKAKQEAATKAVNELFTSNDPATNAVKPTTNQKAIDDAQKAVDAVTDTAKKAALQNNLNKAKELLAAPTTGTVKPNEFTIGDKYITGTYSGDVASISMLLNGEDNKFNGATLKNGEFSFYVNDKKIKKTDVVTMVAYDKSGKELSRQQVKYTAISAGTITPKEMTIPGDKNITGTYTGDVASITVDVKRGETVTTYKGGTVGNGTFTYYSQDKIKASTDVVTVKAFDKDGKQLDTKVIKLKAAVVETKGAITPDTFTVGGKNITGTFTGDVKSLKVTVAGTLYTGGGTINTDGTFKFYVLGKTIVAGDVIEIQALDKTGKVLDTKTVVAK